MKKIKLYKYVIFVVILILLLCTFAAVGIISTVQNKQTEKLNKKELFSYIVYDNQDEKNIKTLVTINSENGIEYIECSDGDKIYGNNKNSITIDYKVKKNENNIFKIKEVEKETKEENIFVDDEYIEKNVISNNVYNISSDYKMLEVKKNIALENFKCYIKIGENGKWVEHEGMFVIYDFYVTQKHLINEDNSITVYEKVCDDYENEVIISSKYNINVDAKEILIGSYVNYPIEYNNINGTTMTGWRILSFNDDGDGSINLVTAGTPYSFYTSQDNPKIMSILTSGFAGQFGNSLLDETYSQSLRSVKYSELIEGPNNLIENGSNYFMYVNSSYYRTRKHGNWNATHHYAESAGIRGVVKLKANVMIDFNQDGTIDSPYNLIMI